MALHAITQRSWIADYLGATEHLSLDLLDVTGFRSGVDGVWCPGHYASLHALAGVDWAFSDALRGE